MEKREKIEKKQWKESKIKQEKLGEKEQIGEETELSVAEHCKPLERGIKTRALDYSTPKRKPTNNPIKRCEKGRSCYWVCRPPN